LGSRFSFSFRSFRLHLFPTNLTWQFWLDAQARSEEFELIKRLLNPGETLIDVGANIGTVSLEATAAVGSSGRIHAIEPHPRIFRYLKSNLKLNDINNVECYPVAIGASASEGCLTDDRRDDMNHLLNDSSSPHTVTVPIRTLDEMFAALPACDLLKLDVEGREVECLSGACKLLTRCRNVLVEVGDPNSTRFGYSSGDLKELLQNHGFTVYALHGSQMSSVDDVSMTDRVGDWVATRDAENLRKRLR
jgi:FkbM family methyltransferase